MRSRTPRALPLLTFVVDSFPRWTFTGHVVQVARAPALIHHPRTREPVRFNQVNME